MTECEPVPPVRTATHYAGCWPSPAKRHRPACGQTGATRLVYHRDAVSCLRCLAAFGEQVFERRARWAHVADPWPLWCCWCDTPLRGGIRLAWPELGTSTVCNDCYEYLDRLDFEMGEATWRRTP
jgi:hypothetical protein